MLNKYYISVPFYCIKTRVIYITHQYLITSSDLYRTITIIVNCLCCLTKNDKWAFPFNEVNMKIIT